jgi:NADH dehydrogenase FAD-containing subunit
MENCYHRRGVAGLNLAKELLNQKKDIRVTLVDKK